MFNDLLPIAAQSGPQAKRPWGKSIILKELRDATAGGYCYYKEKLLVFAPGYSITLEAHAQFSEVWIGNVPYHYILEDEAGVCRHYSAAAYERVHVAPNKKHKIINDSDADLMILELRFGAIMEDDKTQYGEDDIW